MRLVLEQGGVISGVGHHVLEEAGHGIVNRQGGFGVSRDRHDHGNGRADAAAG